MDNSLKNQKKYKYTHVLSSPDRMFLPNLVKIVNCKENDMNPDAHLFVTPYVEIYEELKSDCNIQLVPSSCKNVADMINYVANFSDWILVHNMGGICNFFKIKRKNCKKILWRTWGSDAGLTLGKGNFVKRMIKRILHFFLRLRVRSFYAIGIANTVDKIDISEKYGNVRTFDMDYSSSDMYDKLLELKNKQVKTQTLNILIGHSGYSMDSHIEILKSLQKYKEENICIYLVLSYGDLEYISTVEKYVKEEWPEKCIVIKEMMPSVEYAKFLNEISIAIFDGKASYALGNIAMLLTLEKKIFLNRNGVIKRAFDEQKIPYECTDNICKMDFNAFIESFSYSNCKNNDLEIKSYTRLVSNWKKVFDELNNRTN